MQRHWRKQLQSARSQQLSDELLGELARLAGPEAVRTAEPMSRHTSYRIGGPADLFVQVADLAVLKQVLPLLAGESVPVTIIGGGSNLLVQDGGIRGAVLVLGKGFDYIRVESESEATDTVAIGAATPLGYLIKEAKARGWQGLAPIAGTPGSIGGGLRMNAGDRRHWLGDFVEAVRVVQRDGTEKVLARESLEFGYRTSRLPVGAVIVEGRFRFQKGDPAACREEIEERIRQRKETQPLNLPCAGSVFRNPEQEAAGALVERVGLKGVRLRQAQISPLHANFIVNLGDATARDVLALVRTIKDKVYKETGIRLEEEIRIIGEPAPEDDHE